MLNNFHSDLCIAMENIKNSNLSKIVSSVPNGESCGDTKFVRCSDVILNGNKKPRWEWTGLLCD